jgi:DNA-binding response OmpR family regulator
VNSDIGAIIRRVKAHAHAVDVVVVGRSPSHEDLIEALRAMASDYITRTDDVDVLLSTLLHRVKGYPMAAGDLLKAYQDRYGVFRKYQDDMFRDLKNRITQLNEGALSEQKQTTPATVLILEDEPDLQDNMAIILGEYYTVLCASDGEEALRVIQTHPHIDCAVLDIHVPKLKGDALLVRLKAENPLCQVIILTGFKESGIALSTFKNGAYDYVNKPVTDTVILAKVRDALAVRQNMANSSAYLIFDERIRLFRLFCETSLAAGHGVTYGDLWAFFPEAKTAAKSASGILSTAELESPILARFVRGQIDRAKESERQDQERLVRKWVSSQTG